MSKGYRVTLQTTPDNFSFNMDISTDSMEDFVSKEVDRMEKANFDLGLYQDTVGDELLSQIDVDSLVRENMDLEKRFPQLVSEDKILHASNKTFAKSTVRKHNWSVKAYEDWRVHRNAILRRQENFDDMIMLPIEQQSVEVLCYGISRFIHEVRKVDGSCYPSETLYELVMALQGYLGTKGKEVKFCDDPQFRVIRNNLDNRMKELASQGFVRKNEQSEPITQEEEDKMWEKGTLGEDTPEQLLHTVLYMMGVHFALRGGDEHKSLKIDDIQVRVDPVSKIKFLQYTCNKQKNNQGGIAERKRKPKVVKVYANHANYQRCAVRLFEKYKDVRPSDNPKCSTDLYLRPLAKFGLVGPWFSCQPLGQNTLSKIVQTLCQTSGIAGKKTNHSLKATCATRLYQSGVEEQLIQEKLGNTSEAVRSYKRTSGIQQQKLSDILYGKRRKWDDDVVEIGTVAAKPKAKPSATIVSEDQKPVIADVKPCIDSKISVQTNVNHGNLENAPVINVSPIINVPAGDDSGRPIIVNVNLTMPGFCTQCKAKIDAQK